MLKSKLIRVLKLLTVSELKRFKEFVESPYFNKNKKCVELLNLLIPFSPSFSDEKLNESDFADSVYSQKRSLETLKSVMLRLLEQFLIQQKLENQEEIKTYFLLEELRVRRANKHYNLIYKKSKKNLSQKSKSNSIYYGEYLLEMSQSEMLYQKMASQKAKAIQLEKVIVAFDKYCLSNHLLLDNTIMHIRELGTDEERLMTDELVEQSSLFIQLAKLDPYKDEALIQMRLFLNQLLSDGTELSFTMLLNSLKINHASLSGLDQKHFNKFIANYCIRKIIAGDSSYYRKLLDFYMLAIEIGILIEGRFLHPSRLSNIITTSVKADEIELADNLLKDYLEYIDPEYKNVTNLYCKGYILYQRKKYNDALNYLNKCMALKSLFELNAESIVYKIYYETNQKWAFDIPITSFIAKLSRYRGKQPDYIIEGYINFFRILKQIYQKKHKPNYKKKKKDLISNIEKKELLSDKQWLLEKVDELE